MIERHPMRRTRRAVRLWFAVLSFLAAAPAAARAQVRPDTARTDTVRVPIPPDEVERDTVPEAARREAQDSIGPAPNLPAYDPVRPVGHAVARWEWSRDELQRYSGLSLLELLERVPGLVVTRAGGYGRPAGVSTMGLGGGRVRLFLDGYEVDPFATATVDLQEIALVDLAAVRVERTLQGLRIHLSTFQLPDNRAYSQIEAVTGNYEAKALRAFFSRTFGSRVVALAGLDLASTGGIGLREPFSTAGGRVRASYLLNPTTGFQVEYRQTGAQRESSLYPLDTSRRDLVLRGRTQLRPGLVAEAILGRTTWSDSSGLSLGSTQAVLRSAYTFALGGVEAVGRFRPGGTLGVGAPGTDMEARAALQPLPWLLAEGRARSSALGGVSGTELEGTVRVGPAYGFSAFASLATGARGIGLVRDTLAELVIPPIGEDDAPDTVQLHRRYFPGPASAEAGGLRVGAEWSRFGAVVGGAVLGLRAGTAMPFGLPFDTSAVQATTGASTGVEGYFVLPLPILRRTVQLDGYYVRFSDVAGRPYLPQEQGQLALQIHGLFYDGQFEPSFRIEGIRRGSALVPGGGTLTGGAPTDPYNLVSFTLQLRILDVRAFLVWENLLNNVTAADLPGAANELPGPRTFYGIRWYFRN